MVSMKRCHAIRVNMPVLGNIGQYFANAGRVRAAGVYRTHQQTEGSDEQQQTTSRNGKATENHER